MKAPLVLIAVTLAGCAQLVGIDDPAARDDGGAAIDASDPATADAAAADAAVADSGEIDAQLGPDADRSQCGTLTARFRDVKAAASPGGHPDFEAYIGQSVSRGIVESALGADRLPVLSASRPNAQVTSAASFATWYRDDATLNRGFDSSLRLLSDGGGNLVFDDQFFFPIDGQGFGETFNGQDGSPHNFHFTTEIHASFDYRSGQTILVDGDDDIWIFIGNTLVIDLGGTHTSAQASVALDSLGLTAGQRYPLHIFHAERFTSGSHLRISTSIDCFLPV